MAEPKKKAKGIIYRGETHCYGCGKFLSAVTLGPNDTLAIAPLLRCFSACCRLPEVMVLRPVNAEDSLSAPPLMEITRDERGATAAQPNLPLTTEVPPRG